MKQRDTFFLMKQFVLFLIMSLIQRTMQLQAFTTSLPSLYSRTYTMTRRSVSFVRKACSTDIHDNDDVSTTRKSVTGVIYQSSSNDPSNDPTVQLFTKEGCTLCDKVVDVLKSIKSTHPHSLHAIDITNPNHTTYYDKDKMGHTHLTY